MTSPERKILVPDGDSPNPHPRGVCSKALKIRDATLLYEDLNFGRKPYGRVSRKETGISGCLIEIIPQKSRKLGTDQI